MSRCKTCQAEIVWAVTANGKAMPVDAAPAENGNVRLVERGPGQAPSAEVLGPLERELADDRDELRWPHHATCPNWSGAKP